MKSEVRGYRDENGHYNIEVNEPLPGDKEKSELKD